MADKFETKTTGLEVPLGRIHRIKSMYREIGVRAGCENTSGTITQSQGKGKPRITLPDLRDAGKNTIILRWHAKGGGVPRKLASGQNALNAKGKKLYQHVPARDVITLSQQELDTGNKIWRNGIVDIVNRNKASAELDRRAVELGEHLVATWRRHIDKSYGAAGPLKPTLEGTQKSKERQVGPGGRNLPPLKRTGQLYRSLSYTIKVYR